MMIRKNPIDAVMSVMRSGDVSCVKLCNMQLKCFILCFFDPSLVNGSLVLECALQLLHTSNMI